MATMMLVCDKYFSAASSLEPSFIMKLDEIIEVVAFTNASLVLFGHDLSPLATPRH